MIENLLNAVPEKYQYVKTTSKKFKLDLYNFFNKSEFKELSCMEIGCARGHTTLILSKLFKQVYAINDIDTSDAQKFCNSNGSSNVEFFSQDVYKYGLKLRSENKKYIIFDDTGICPEVLNIVKEKCDLNILQLITPIGCKPGDAFHRELYDHEGLICREV